MYLHIHLYLLYVIKFIIFYKKKNSNNFAPIEITCKTFLGICISLSSQNSGEGDATKICKLCDQMCY